jgi:uncharacterized membrane protein YuzA (DUF378 family)
MIWKLILWTIIGFIGFNLIVSKGGDASDFTSATIISFIIGPTIGFLVFKQSQKKSNSK